MGVDCTIYAFPPRRLPRYHHLDRYFVMMELLESRCPDRAWDTMVDARMMRAILAGPLVRSEYVTDEYDPKVGGWNQSREYRDHWRIEALNFAERICLRFGPDTPMLIVSEHDDWTVRDFIDKNAPGLWKRFNRRKDYGRSVEQRKREAEARAGFEQVKRELAEKFKHQWD